MTGKPYMCDELLFFKSEMENIKDLIKTVHDQSKEMGWHEGKSETFYYLKLVEGLIKVSKCVSKTNKTREFKKGVDEIEMDPDFQGYRHLINIQWLQYYISHIHNSVGDLLADVCIWALDMAGEFETAIDSEPLLSATPKTTEDLCVEEMKKLSEKEDPGILLLDIESWCHNNRFDLPWYIEQRIRWRRLNDNSDGLLKKDYQ